MKHITCAEASSSKEATIGGLELNVALARIGLGSSECRLRENGFSDWESMLGITESDMSEMSLRLGDRRKIQRMISDHKASNISKSNSTRRSPPDPRREQPYDRHKRTDSKSYNRRSTAGRNPATGLPSLDLSERLQRDRDDGGNKDLDARFHKVSKAVKAGLEEVHRITKDLSIDEHLFKVTTTPQEAVTANSVEAFFQCTGALVYLWSYNQAMQEVRSLYDPVNGLDPTSSVEVFAMAAVGSYCDGSLQEKKSSSKFLEYFSSLLSSPLMIRDLLYMRLFACLAICRFTDSTDSARILLSSSLEIGREAFTSQLFKATTPEEELRHWWHVFQSVIFLESWFANITHQEVRVKYDDLHLYHIPQSKHQSTPDTYQARIFELGRLATYAALGSKKEVEGPPAMKERYYLESLMHWQRTLPPFMQLSHISLSAPLALSSDVKRSLLHLHILFLGLFIAPHKKCMLVLGQFRLGDIHISVEDLEALTSVESQCVLAARQSSRVASLVQFDNLVRAHSWILLYASYVGGTVLLHSAAQKLLECSRDDVGLELAYASSHLSILSLCSYESEVARRMYTSLQVVFNDLKDLLTLPIGANSMRESRQDHMIHSPQHVRRTTVQVAKEILKILEGSITF
ncbi:hypothetical protein K491DRAFT_763129 [Lophiostoma macrostomum CBS 122681]|uniref:Transcription factor domain-containing protein n=1 Tax=Lophiostoma macrostomum CBS 122681 TaxID=1314788 RepID=A0A6A6SN21_9PLEO|nr:hypothetical protein K491DRAFT_763129 [Lophiostoma macrostomum CBS 122681]